MKVVLVPGTWANSGRDDPQDIWWKVGSLFAQEAVRHGLECLSFAWSTNLDGVAGGDTDWEQGGASLFRQVKDLQPLRLIAHSHGGNVAAFACAAGLKVRTLITVATPVRNEVPYDKARPNIDSWIHIYGNYQDYTQILGELAIGKFVALRRQMKLADGNIKYPAGHSELHDPHLWRQQGWFDLVK